MFSKFFSNISILFIWNNQQDVWAQMLLDACVMACYCQGGGPSAGNENLQFGMESIEMLGFKS